MISTRSRPLPHPEDEVALLPLVAVEPLGLRLVHEEPLQQRVALVRVHTLDLYHRTVQKGSQCLNLSDLKDRTSVIVNRRLLQHISQPLS